MKIAFILGTRPEIIKLFPCILECVKRQIFLILIHTNQHYDSDMDSRFFSELGLEPANYNLGVGSGSHATMTATMLEKIEPILVQEKPDWVVVQGDTNSTLSGALTASKLGIRVAHVEAGLRSYDRAMPEEINRIITDHVSSALFCPAHKQADILQREGISSDQIHITGNTIVDAVRLITSRIQPGNSVEKFGLEPQKYCLLTCHRPSNTDNQHHFQEIIEGIHQILEAQDLTCFFPMHPRIQDKKPFLEAYPRIKVAKPVGYVDLLQLQTQAHCIFTDSGGIQEEACILEKKCLILRSNTERPETIEVGGAALLPRISRHDLVQAYRQLRDKTVSWTNPFGDGFARTRIVDILLSS